MLEYRSNEYCGSQPILCFIDTFWCFLYKLIMTKIIYPDPLAAGATIAITAPSSGLDPEYYPRLELVKSHLAAQGFKVIEGNCLRHTKKHRSGSRVDRAKEFVDFWMDESVKAIMPPWGGEFLIEILSLIDFNKLKAVKPKWISGYSDLSTLHFAMTLKTGIATLHGSNLMDLAPAQADPLTTSLMKCLQLKNGDKITQASSEKYQIKHNDFCVDVGSSLNLTEPTQWKLLPTAKAYREPIQGRLIGGCLDTIARLVGTPFGDLNAFKNQFSHDGVIFYFEVCDMKNNELIRTLWNLRLAGWFEDLNGIVIGRSNNPAPKSSDGITYEEALKDVLSDLSVPVIYDVDIGHRPPQFNIINGALGELAFSNGRGSLTQLLV